MNDEKQNLAQLKFPVVVAKASQLVGPAASDSGASDILLLDPALCHPFSGNGRAESPFDPSRNRALIESIRVEGQVTPAIVRRAIGDNDTYQIVAGTRRWHVVSYLRAHGAPDAMFMVRVVDLDDKAAWRESLAENVGRAAYTPLQLARSWRWAIDNVYTGEQQAFAVARGIDPAVVSRTIALLEIPPVVQAAHADFERASVHFAELVAPALRDPERCLQILKVAASLVDAGVTLAGPRLVERLLLPPAEIEGSQPRTWPMGEKQRAATWTQNVAGAATLRLAVVDEHVRRRDRVMMLAALTAELRQHLRLSTATLAAPSGDRSGAGA